ncbi:hypothetical protein RND71_009271 [Anisodus tanguticus]|uniref:Uncharacterized protein n=1 Tax=Anisodus tanguticus TaxID=243964 RepID=A0AAE1SHI0_9SOLA|nr:hypothetical protein RND71_009271 [Anisodus tanguticus]
MGFWHPALRERIQWKYPLLSNAKKAYIRCKRLYYIELLGLKGLQPYATLRVLRQLGQEQIIPLRANMRISEIPFEPNFIVPRARQVFDEWNDIDTIDIGVSQAGGTPEYQAWLREDCSSTDHSPDGEQGFEDIGTTIWVRNFRLRDTVVTPEMWHQMQNIVRYLEDAESDPKNVRVPSSSRYSIGERSEGKEKQIVELENLNGESFFPDIYIGSPLTGTLMVSDTHRNNQQFNNQLPYWSGEMDPIDDIQFD